MGLYERCEKVYSGYICCVCTLGFRQYSKKLLLVLCCELQVSLSQLYYLPSLMMFITERYRFMKMRCFRKVLFVRDVQYYCPFENGLIYQILHKQGRYLVFKVIGYFK